MSFMNGYSRSEIPKNNIIFKIVDTPILDSDHFQLASEIMIFNSGNKMHNLYQNKLDSEGSKLGLLERVMQPLISGETLFKQIS